MANILNGEKNFFKLTNPETIEDFRFWLWSIISADSGKIWPKKNLESKYLKKCWKKNLSINLNQQRKIVPEMKMKMKSNWRQGKKIQKVNWLLGNGQSIYLCNWLLLNQNFETKQKNKIKFN